MKGETMDAKEYLQQIGTLETKVKIILEEIEEIKALLGVKAINYDKVSFSPNINESDRLLTLILKLIDKQNQLVEEYIKLTEKRAEIREKVYQLADHKEIEVLYCRYFLRMRWEAIADKLGYTVRQITNIHGLALQHLQQII